MFERQHAIRQMSGKSSTFAALVLIYQPHLRIAQPHARTASEIADPEGRSSGDLGAGISSPCEIALPFTGDSRYGLTIFPQRLSTSVTHYYAKSSNETTMSNGKALCLAHRTPGAHYIIQNK